LSSLDATHETPYMQHMNATIETCGAFMTQCLMIMQDDDHDRFLVAS
jgi:hypothetical protein